MKKKISKTEAKEKIENFFELIKTKTPKEIKKIKTLANSQRISLKNKKNLFCKKCLKPSINSKIRVKSGNKIIICKNCGAIKRFKLS